MKFLFLVFCFSLQVYANTQPLPTPAEARLTSYKQHQELAENSLLGDMPFENIGPVVQGGRVVDIDVNPVLPSVFFVAYASGGLWKTSSNGSDFTPVFDREAAMTIGDIAVDWQHNIIWVGTGEANSSRSSMAGVGLYRSADDGKTWVHKGLADSHHIGKILLHPQDANTLWVAVLGHLYTPNEERGVFKSTDGGDSWQKVLYIDDQTGAIDLINDPANPDILYAAMWHRERKPWNLVESGSTSSIYKSVDGGEHWTNLITDKSGFPAGEGVGRIGLTAARGSDKTILYAIIDNQSVLPAKEEKKEKQVLTKADLRDISKADFLKLEPKRIDSYLRKNNFPGKYKADDIIRLVKNDKIKPQALVDYLEDANNQLFETHIIGAEVYKSDDEGLTWVKQNSYGLEDLYYNYGYYFGQIRVAFNNPDKLYILGVPILKSENGGKTWKSINADNVHGDHHALWIDPKLPGHLIDGNDGGINISYDDGKSWFKCNTPPVGQCYAVNVDQTESYNVYCGLQDNGVWVGNHQSATGTYWQQSGHYDFKEILGGDGMQIMIDPRDNTTVYTGFQFGNYFRINKNTERTDEITPEHELGEVPLRFNWQTPIWLSRHNPDILYLGAQRLCRSLNKGKDWEPISTDLTKGGKKGDVPYGTITTIHESPLKFGLLYVGTDDGNIYVTRDGGDEWTIVSDDLPHDLWVSRVSASAFEKGRVYASLNGSRADNFSSYIYASENYGQTWNQIGLDLPLESVNVIKEDPVNENILYVGTDLGLYISLNKGRSFMLMNKNMPSVSVHDIVVQEKKDELVVGTHGRSVFIYPLNIIHQMNDSILDKDIYIFDNKTLYHDVTWGKSYSKWEEIIEPEMSFPVLLRSEAGIELNIKTPEGLIIKHWTEAGKKGLNFIAYHLDIDPEQINGFEKEFNKTHKQEKEDLKLKKADSGKYYLLPGKYTLAVKAGDFSFEKEFEIKE